MSEYWVTSDTPGVVSENQKRNFQNFDISAILDFKNAEKC